MERCAEAHAHRGERRRRNNNDGDNTYLASATASNMTHCAPGGRCEFGTASPLFPIVLLSLILRCGCCVGDGDGEIAGCRCFREGVLLFPFTPLPLVVLGIAGPGSGLRHDAGCWTSGGGPSALPPSSTTHWTRYVFRMWENMCSTSPAGTIFTTHTALGHVVAAVGPTGVGLVSSCGLRVAWIRRPVSCSEASSCSSSESISISPLETRRDRDEELGLELAGGAVRSAERSVPAILVLAGGDATDTFTAVGNSCRPARSPKRYGKPSRKQIQGLALSNFDANLTQTGAVCIEEGRACTELFNRRM